MICILGLNAYHGDSSACVVRDGVLLAAAEEERFRRTKHWAGFPSESIAFCLKDAGIDLKDVDHVAVNRDPWAHWHRKMLYSFAKNPSLTMVRERFQNASKIWDLKEAFRGVRGAGKDSWKAPIHHVEHHRAHMSSAFFVSAFDSAAVVSVDGFGDFVSAMWAVGTEGSLDVKGQVYFPHSLGLFYLALTQYLGFTNYGDEYKVMGLAPYGRPVAMDQMRRIVELKKNGQFALSLDFFLHHAEGVSMVWENGEPKIGTAYSQKLVDLLGPPRKPEEPIQAYHKDVAASLQCMYEEAFFNLLNHVYDRTQNPRLCLAGGCAMNSVANGKIFDRTPFRELYIQPAAGDAGGAIGAAYYVWHTQCRRPRSFVMKHAYWGPQFGRDEIERGLNLRREELKKENCLVQEIDDPNELCRQTAQFIAEGSVVGWFQGRMEWGPRALGHRSILGDPRRSDMKDILNEKIKRRESFRPFAPSILREKTHEWFETDSDVPFMAQVYKIRESQKGKIPAVTHVDGSGRLHTVTRDENPLYYDLIRTFEDMTGVPILLNTSFNENEPIVCRFEEALECFLRTHMDVLVLDRFLLRRLSEQPA